MRGRRRADNSGSGRGRNAGVVKLATLVTLAALLLLLVFTLGVQQTKAADCDCGYCHGDNHHGDNWTGCSGCHDSPPQTGAHLAHYNSAPVQSLKYGDTTIASTDDAYKFGCGNCHPLDKALHRNGILEVELYNTAAAAGSLKAKNPSSAAYVPGANVTTYPSNVAGQPGFSWSDGACSNIYCHSGYTVTSGPVGNPLTFPPSIIPQGSLLNYYGYIMDETCSTLTYDPYTTNYQRVYATTPAWGTSGSFATCAECHEFPLMTDYTTVQAGVGDSHGWVNEWGWSYGHANNMEYFPGIPCRTCHYGTVDQEGSNYRDPDYLVVYDPVPLKSRVMHVNGSPDVVFDTVNGYRYYYPGYIDNSYNLSLATYAPATKTCSDVSCHYNPNGPVALWQKKVTWGTPYRGWEGPDQECDQCHRMGYLGETCTAP